ncbi:uncharacterized protein N0V89_004483 [Didymosphaeria variabile]|uniref:Beta-lactamase/transpeptidase-like protein n=1 Tax=Didymosphaeria variabile TaxID=1932322 RepID=A0A9W8XSJ7_9PLEO|nr:uncharacterized protein N0V89_004483 [Didymosphaeria variabile]KAJ4356450.1 hypothetical protein N0V89_004483 [Didymosphaeria variabile]
MEVAKGTLTWYSKVGNYLPSFASRSTIVENECKIVDMLFHSTGLSDYDVLWDGPDNRLLLSRADAVPIFAVLPSAGTFRASFVYNNWGYELVGQILERVTGKSLSQLLHERFFKPLNMTRTSTQWDHPSRNMANSYTVLDDRSVIQVPRPTMEKGNLMEAAGGVKSSLGDLILLYTEMLEALTSADANEQPPNNVFRNSLEIFGSTHPLPGWSLREQSYGMGWCRAQLPGQLGRISENVALRPQPVVGKDSPSRLDIYHHGSMCGSTTVVNLIPETQSVVIALRNSLGPVDVADFAAELLIECLLNVPKPIEYVELALGDTLKAFEYMDRIKHQLDQERIPGTVARPATDYVGTYWNQMHNWRIDVSHDEEDLFVSLQGPSARRFPLEHYHYDTFSWWMPYNDVMRSAQYVIGTTAHTWLMQFEANNLEAIKRLKWALEGPLPDYQETFTRETTETAHDLTVPNLELLHLRGF